MRPVLGKWQPALLLALMACLPFQGEGKWSHFIVETNSITITEPASMAGTYEAAIGDFGVPLYGGTLVGRVEFHSENADGCKNFTAPPSQGEIPRILLLDRGDCYFVQKAWHAQLAGAKAVVVADHTQEPLVTMAIPFDHDEVAEKVEEISIPVVLVTKDAGAKLKEGLGPDGRGNVVLELDWRESITHPDDRVEWEFWFSTNDGCGEACSSQKAFLKNFRGTGSSLDRDNHTRFTPHMLSRHCFSTSEHCRRDCIHGGKYCAWDSVAPQFREKYQGAQVVEENKRHMCVFKHLNDTHKPWLWWDIAARFADQCTMAAGSYGKGCAEGIMQGLGIDPAAVAGCMGDPEEGTPSPILEAERRAQQDDDDSGRGKVILLPTIVINRDQYRGRLDPPSVLRALCAGFKEGTEPPVCLTGGLNVDDCATRKDDCWVGPQGHKACVDTFRGFVCMCPPGWQGDGHTCQDVDECAQHIDGCDQKCINTQGSYRCECNRGYALHGGLGSPGICVPSSISRGLPAWAVLLISGGTLALVVAGAIAAYKWRLRREMHGEIRSIMRQYMPLDAQERGDGNLDRTLLTPRGGGGGGKLVGRGGGPLGEEDEEVDKHFFSPTGPPVGTQRMSLTELAQTASPRNYPTL